MSSSKKRMGGLGSLSSFSTTTAKPEPEPPTSSQSTSEAKQSAAPSKPGKSSSTPAKPRAKKAIAPPQKNQAEQQVPLDKLVTVNIKIAKTQQKWLAETATQVRDNNQAPVPPSERVYPQHLIGVAIDLLQTAEIDWETIRNIRDLKKVLGL